MSDAAPGLGARQATLVAALTGAGAPPAGFDAGRFAAARAALAGKRGDVVAGSWPELARDCGPRWRDLFGQWAAGRPPGGAYADGWGFARDRLAAGLLGPAAAVELAAAAARRGRPGRRRRLPVGFGRAGGAAALRVGRRLWLLRRP